MARMFCIDKFNKVIKSELNIEDYYQTDNNSIQFNIKESVINYIKVYPRQKSIEVFDCEEEIIAHYRWDGELNYNNLVENISKIN